MEKIIRHINIKNLTGMQLSDTENIYESIIKYIVDILNNTRKYHILNKIYYISEKEDYMFGYFTNYEEFVISDNFIRDIIKLYKLDYTEVKPVFKYCAEKVLNIEIKKLS